MYSDSECADIIQNSLEEVTEIVLRYLPTAPMGDTIDPDAPLTGFGLDSMSSISLLFDLEETLEITFPETWLERDTFSTLRAICCAVRAIRGEQGAAR